MGHRVRHARRRRAAARGPHAREHPRRQAGEEQERRITTTVDIRAKLPRKREALFAHGSQIGGESWFSKIPADIAEATFGRESFIRASDTTGTPLPEDDLFTGLRS